MFDLWPISKRHVEFRLSTIFILDISCTCNSGHVCHETEEYVGNVLFSYVTRDILLSSRRSQMAKHSISFLRVLFSFLSSANLTYTDATKDPIFFSIFLAERFLPKINVDSSILVTIYFYRESFREIRFNHKLILSIKNFYIA